MISWKSLKIWRDGLEGILANIIQNIFFSLFFIILIRNYSKNIMGYYLISNILYSTISSLGGLGIGNSYLRSHQESSEKADELHIFTITLLVSGFIMCLVNMAFSWFFYPHPLVHKLSWIFCCHIFIDNLFYIFRYHQFALDNQKKAYRVVVLDSILKFLTGCILFFYVLDIYQLMLIMTVVRVILILMIWLLYMPIGMQRIRLANKKNIPAIFVNNFQKN